MIKFVIEKIRQYWGYILAIFLWLCIWATYNTDIFRIFIIGFPYSFFDLVHGIRSIFPFIALAIAVSMLVKFKKLNLDLFKSPLGLLLLYSIIGICASLFSKNPIGSLYWGSLYLAVIIVLLAIVGNPKLSEKISLLIKINWIIAGVIAVGLLVFFLIQPGVISSFTYNFLICKDRPYEGMSGIGAEMNTFDMAGTRPTGWGRYAGIVAIFSLVGFLYAKSKTKNKYLWFLLFVLFLIILFFSKGKTAIIGFSIAMIFSIWLSRKISIKMFLMACFVTVASIFVVFYDVPCTNQTVINFLSRFSVGKVDIKPITPPITQPITPPITLRTNVVTLSGRTGGVWTDAMHLFLKNPIFGFGFQADRYFLNGQHAHNSIVHALVQAGILGTVPFVLAFVLTLLMLVRLLKNQNIEQKERNFLIMLSAVLVFFGVRSITESVAFFSADWLFVAPIIAYIQCLDGQVKKENKSTQMYFRSNKINLLKVSDVIEKMKYWIKNESQKLHWIIVTGMHGVVEAEKHPDFKFIVSNADMWVPDGISLVWLAKLKGFDIKERVSGADLMKEFFQVADRDGLSSYFYGDTEETLGALNQELLKKYPNLKIAGNYSPPFRELTKEEDEEIIKKINQAKPDVLWVALGLPKQEKWIFEHRDKLKVPIVIGVGAAFKFLSGKVKRAPKWIGDLGFEWLWRLIKEPKVTWKRVFIDIPVFIWLIIEDFFNNNYKTKMIISPRRLLGKILLFIEKNILFPIGVFIGPKLLKELTPYDVKGFEEKTRLGNLFDGGYVVPLKILSLIDVVYTYGVADDTSFEEDLVKHADINVRLYDHTINGLPVENGRFFFKKQGIAERKYGNFDTFKNNLKENNDIGRKIILKLDVEGAEWQVLENILDESSKDIVAIVLEIHKLYRYEKIMSYIKLFKKINSKFTLVHLHGNNICSLVTFGNKKLSDVLELTLINNNLIGEKVIMSHSLPSEKDYPNAKEKDDLLLDFWENK